MSSLKCRLLRSAAWDKRPLPAGTGVHTAELLQLRRSRNNRAGRILHSHCTVLTDGLYEQCSARVRITVSGDGVMKTDVPDDVPVTAERARADRTAVPRRVAVPHLDVTLQRAVRRELQTALLAGELVRSAAVLVGQQVRVRVGHVVEQRGRSRELPPAAVARALVVVLVHLPPVKSQRRRADEHLAALVAAVLHGPEMNRRDVVSQQRRANERPRTVLAHVQLLSLVNWQTRMFRVNMLGKVASSSKNHATFLALVFTMHLNIVPVT